MYCIVEDGKQEKNLMLRWDDPIGDKVKFEELPVYEFEKLAIATKDFDLSNKLGQGGFGPVYKVIIYIASKKSYRIAFLDTLS